VNSRLAPKREPTFELLRPGLNRRGQALKWTGLAATAAVAVWLVTPGHHPPTSLMHDQIALVQRLERTSVGLLRNYGVLQRVDLPKNPDLTEHLDELTPVTKRRHARRHHWRKTHSQAVSYRFSSNHVNRLLDGSGIWDAVVNWCSVQLASLDALVVSTEARWFGPI
jgi:hypothetical protein